jgi:hypothetical protein
MSAFDAISARVASTHTNLNRHNTRGKTRPHGLLYKCAYYVSIQKIRYMWHVRRKNRDDNKVEHNVRFVKYQRSRLG